MTRKVSNGGPDSSRKAPEGAGRTPPSLRSFDLNLLILFDTLYETRKLGEAAQKIGLSQPAASQALTRLREAFGDTLFERRGRGMEPTPRARRMAPAVREALATLERGLSALRSFDPAASERTFDLGLTAIGEMTFLPSLVHRVRVDAPRVCVRSIAADVGELPQLVLDRRVDIGVDFRPPPHPSLISEKLYESELVIIARVGHPRISGTASISELLSESWVRVNLDDATRERFSRLVGIEQLIDVQVGAYVSHYTSLPSVVMETDGIALVPRAIVEASRVYIQNLQLIPAPIPLERAPAYIYWHESYEDDPGHAWLRGIIRSLAAEWDGS